MSSELAEREKKKGVDVAEMEEEASGRQRGQRSPGRNGENRENRMKCWNATNALAL